MSKYYIGNRLDHSVMAAVLSVESVSYLNKGMSSKLATVAMQQGIKKSQKGKGLNFWSVTQEQMEFLTAESSATFITLKTGDEWRPLLVVDADLMTTKLQEVNSKYPQRMDYATSCKYNKDLIAAISASVKKINEDKKIKVVREEKKGNIAGIKVGDYVRFGYRHPDFGIVTRVTKSSYWFAPVAPCVGYISNVNFAKDYFNNVTETTRGDYGDMGFKVPFAGNEEMFDYNEVHTTMKRFDGHERAVDCWEHVPSDAN